LASELCLGTFGLGTLAWELWLGAFGLGALTSEPWLGHFGNQSSKTKVPKPKFPNLSIVHPEKGPLDRFPENGPLGRFAQGNHNQGAPLMDLHI